MDINQGDILPYMDFVAIPISSKINNLKED